MSYIRFLIWGLFDRIAYMRSKHDKERGLVAKKLTEADLENIFKKISKVIKDKREVRSKLDDFAYETNISRSTAVRAEAGEDLMLSNFLRIVYGLDIKFSEFFKEIESVVFKETE
jgi:predicted transcriptional regulator